MLLLALLEDFLIWKKDENNKKTPQFIYKKDNTNLYFAGLYQKNENLEFTIITREASSELKNIHSRMPVVLEEKDILKYVKQNIFGDKIVIGMVAGSISNWIKELPDLL